MKFEFVTADYKDFSGFVEQLEKSLKTFGLNMYSDPQTDGSDTIGIIITSHKITDKHLNELSDREWNNE